MFGIDMFDASLIPAMSVALIAGVLSFLSPCVLPIVPPYLAYIGGMSMQDLTASRDKSLRRRAIWTTFAFVFGLSTVFVMLGLLASSIGGVFISNQTLFAQIAGAVIIIFGLHFIGIFRIGILYREARFQSNAKGGSYLGAYVLGLAFAFGWTPCIGPVLGAILALSGQEESVARGATLTAAYSFGLGIPFLIAAIFIERAMGLMNRMKAHMRKVEIAMGLLLVLIGIAMITGGLARFSFWLLEKFPALAQIG